MLLLCVDDLCFSFSSHLNSFLILETFFISVPTGIESIARVRVSNSIVWGGSLSEHLQAEIEEKLQPTVIEEQRVHLKAFIISIAVMSLSLSLLMQSEWQYMHRYRCSFIFASVFTLCLTFNCWSHKGQGLLYHHCISCGHSTTQERREPLCRCGDAALRAADCC